MDWSNPIVYELGLTVFAVVGFWIWQTRDLKKAARELKERSEAEPRQASASVDADKPH